jgi:hypothetical protein
MIRCGVGRENEALLTTQVAAFTTSLDAELARSLLESHDIPSRLEGDLLVGAALPLQTALGGVKVLVTANDAVRASELITKHERELSTERRRSDTADERVARAYRLALIGLMLLPVAAQLISLVNILRAPWSALSAKGRRQYVIGLVFDLIVVGSAAYWLANWSTGEVPDVTNTMPQTDFGK